MARARIRLIYGGGGIGLMGRVAEGVMAGGGRVTGIMPRHLFEREIGDCRIDEMIVVESMHERKMAMADRADGFVVLPGGFGTLDEFFEIVTWRQLGLHDKPIILVDLGDYWAPIEAMTARILVEGFAAPAHRLLYRRVDRIDAVLAAVAEDPATELPLETGLA
jgi:uncharacterized protein (TIGR00730 family)